MRYDRARQSPDRHATYIVATFIAGSSRGDVGIHQQTTSKSVENGARRTGLSVIPLRCGQQIERRFDIRRDNRHSQRVASDRGDEYLEAIAAIRQVVNAIDPIGLIAMGAPEDEYDAEVADLARLVMRPASFDETDVDAVWRRWFGDDYAAMHRVESLPEQTLALRRLQEQYGTPR